MIKSINKIITGFICLIGLMTIAKAQDISCEYSMKKDDGAKCSSGSVGYITKDETFTVVIYMDTTKNELDKSFPKFTLNSKNGGYTNNVTSVKETSFHLPLKHNNKLVSAKEYYKAVGGCPPYFGVFLDYEVYYGTFGSQKKEIEGCVFPLKSLEYTEEFEQKDELYSCTLYSSDALLKDIKVNVQINYTQKTISFGNIITDERDGAKEALNNYKKNFDFSIKNKCPVNELKVCELPGYTFIYTKDFSDHPSGTCGVLDSTEKLKVGNTYCKYVIELAKSIKSSEIGYYNQLSKVKSYCTQVLKINNYDNIKYSCIDVCLNIEDYLPGIEFNSDKCGFSERLMIWIANIIRWVKYIIPVAVIVFGILDFMKAIGADKEDEMKKAQQRFIKRLIAAALIFLTPVIIEFIINKMGFEANGCGIINL